MRLEFGLVKKFVAALAVAVSASSVWAAAVAPLHFDGVEEGQQQKFWDDLMAFKMWGTRTINFNAAELLDVVGAIGSTGNIVLGNSRQYLGGPIYVGGNIGGSTSQDQFLSGPTRVKGNLTISNNNSKLNGTTCIEGEGLGDIAGAMARADSGHVYIGDDAKTGACAYNKVKDVPTNLFIPTLPAGYPSGYTAINKGNFSVNDNYTVIDVPPIDTTINGNDTTITKMYDFYFSSMTFANECKLTVRMNSSSSLARFFIDGKLSLTAGANIQVAYVDAGAKYNYSSNTWENVSKVSPVPDTAYAGNLLFYTTQDFSMPSMHGSASIQGSFVSTGIIEIGSNLHLAGQFLAEEIKLGNELDGKAFHYVPFDAPVLKLVPEVGAKFNFPENDTWVKIPIKLDSDPKTDVQFDYCFEFAPDWYFSATNDDGVLLNELNPAASTDDVTINAQHNFPLCGDGSGVVKIPFGSREPVDDSYSIWINVKIDNVVEPSESVRLQISNIQGATMPGGERSGSFEIFLIDGDNDPSSDDKTISVREDVVYTFTGGTSAKGTLCEESVDFCYHSTRDREQAGVTIASLPDPEHGTLYFQGEAIKGEGQFVTVEQLANGDLTFVSASNYFDRGDNTTSFTFTVTDVGDAEAGFSPAVSDPANTITIKVLPVNDAPTITKNQSMSVDENSTKGTIVGAFEAVDIDGDVLSFAFDSEDENYETVSALFEINSESGVVTVKEGAVLDYESVSSYTITVKVTDDASTTGGTGVESSSETLVININDVNEKQSVVVKDLEGKVVATDVLTVDENSEKATEVGYVLGDDPDTKAVDKTWYTFSYTIVENTDADKTNDVPFAIDSKTGLITVTDKSALNYEVTPEIVVTVRVSDLVEKADGSVGQFVVDKVVTIKLNDVPEKPAFADKTPSLDVDENTLAGTEVGVVAAIDDDCLDNVCTALTYEMVAVADEGHETDNTLFVIDPATGKITVKADSTLNFEVKNEYKVQVIVYDGEKGAAGTFSDTAVVTIAINDVNDAPVFADKALEVPENSKVGTVVGTVAATDEDKWSVLSYTLADISSEDAVAALFEIDPETGVITVAKENTLDYESRSEYKVYAIVTDNGASKGFTDLADTAVITIKVTDVDEKPGFADKTPTLDVDENTLAGTEVGVVVAIDDDCKDNVCDDLLYELLPATGAATDYTFFTIDSKTGKVTVKADSTLNYEVKNEYKVNVVVYDGVKGEASTMTDTAVVTIKINDVNDAPVVANKTLEVPENSKVGTLVGTVVASDEDTWSVLTYSLADVKSTDAVASLFAVDSKGNITVAKDNSLDFETRDEYQVLVIVKDNGSAKGFKDLYDTATITIKVTNVDENPEIVDDGKTKYDVNENSANGTVVASLTVKDQDASTVLTSSITDKNKTGAEKLFTTTVTKSGDDWTVTVKVADGSALDYEKIPQSYNVTIKVTDESGLSSEIDRVINIVDVNENPVVAKQNFEIKEHQDANVVVGTVKASDLDTAAKFTDNVFEIVGGTDKSLFNISEAGVITAANKVFDFESEKQEYKIVVAVKDRKDPTLVATDTMTIVLKNIPETPSIAVTEFDVDEHVSVNTPIDTLTANDPDCKVGSNCKFTYELVEPSEYVTVTETGVILVKDSSKFNYETLTSFDIKVVVTDEDGLKSETTTVTIKINDVNEAPSIVDQTITVSEDAKPNTILDTVVAVDPDTKSTEFSNLTYTIVGGDSTVFKVDPKTGEVILKDSLDYEKKNEYSLVVEVFDGQYSDTATVTIKVENVIEKSDVEITKVISEDSTWVKPDTVFTNRPAVTICWNEGREVCEKANCTIKSREVCQDTTLTEGTHTIIKEYLDPTTDVPGRDSVVVFVSTSTPIVTVTANVDASKDVNIYTIEESVNAKDSSVYVNDPKNDIRVTIKDPVNKKDSSFVVKLDLDTLNVSKKDLETVSSVVNKGSISLNLNPSSGTTRTPVNGSEVKMSYTEEVNGKKVTVSYLTDNDGEILKTPVVDEKGKVDSIEVITVSYETKIGGKTVTVSYQADAITGQALNVASDGTLTFADKIITSASSTGKPASSSSGSKPSSSSSGSKPGSSSSSDSKPAGSSNETVINVGSYKVTYDYVDEKGNSVVVTYTIDDNGNIVKNDDGDIGYSVSYTYVNKFGNSATQSVFIVLDQAGPKVEILYPTHMQTIRANYVEVTWAVNGVIQDTLTMQGLEKGANKILRYYRDKAGNEAYDSVVVIMKDVKDVDINTEHPVVEITQDKVDEYYAVNPPKEGEKLAVSIRNPSTGKEVETQILGTFGTEDGSGEAPYPGIEEGDHLGPTLTMEVRLPVVNDVGGLATLDDLIGSDGLVSLDGLDAKNAEKVSVQEYVDTYCVDDFKLSGDASRTNLYNTKMEVRVWIYTTLGSFVDYYSYKQELNDPDYTNEAGLLYLFSELKPDSDGEVRTEDGRVLATGAYLYKVEARIRAELKCTLPPVKDQSASAKKKGDIIKKSDELLKPFGYKRPNKK